MDTASFEFLAFGLAVAILSNLSRSSVWRSTVAFTASIVFLGILAGKPLTLLPLAGFLALGYVGLLLLQRGWTKSLVWSILAVVFAYVCLKKYTFLPEVFFIHSPYFTLGLSYIFFRVLHLLIESGDHGEERKIGIGAYLLYTLNFTTLISGPIQRYDQFSSDQFASEPIALGPRVIAEQLERIVVGLFKVTVLAMLFDTVRVDALAQMSLQLPPSYKMYAAFRLAVIYPFFLYANFSGYIDVVIAIARLMRVRLPENFDRPFSASSFLDFWNRWHITLSSWLKTYVYNPLLIGLMRRIPSVTIEPFLGVFSFFVTFFLVGVWHGRTSEFVVFGILQGGGVAVNKLWQISLTKSLTRKGYKSLAANPVYVAFGRGLTFTWFAFTLFWFWANWKDIHTIFGALSLGQSLAVWSGLFLTATAVLALWEWLRARALSVQAAGEPLVNNRYIRIAYAVTLLFVTFLITVLLNQPAPAIVYKAF